MNEKNVFLILGSVFILVLGGILLFLINPNLTGNVVSDEDNTYIQKMPILFSVTDQKIIGVNADTDALKYGTIMIGNTGKRDITIFNPFSIPVRVELFVSENIRNLTRLGYDNFVLQANNDSLKFSVIVKPDETTFIGDHNGTLKVVMRPI